MRLIDIEMLERELHLLKIKLKKSHDFIKKIGKWKEYIRKEQQ
tara:strand:- start:2269 stop:2397 length:129 start_codon:yes stop_codon:yes gene_type:complete